MKPIHDPYAPCPCGSGKKYKFCCLTHDRETAREADASARGDFGADAPDNVMMLDLFEGEKLNDQGMRRLQRGDWKGAEEGFRAAIRAAPPIPAGHNNLANTLFLSGDIQEAIRLQEKALAELPLENKFGMAQLVHFYLVAGREAEGEAMLTRAVASKPTDAYAVTKTCQSLARFGRHRQVLELADGFAGPLDDALHWYAGVAAANLGLIEIARQHLGAMTARTSLRPRARDLLRRLETGASPGTIEGDWSYFDSGEIVPPLVVVRALADAEAGREGVTAVLNSRAMADMTAALLSEDEDSSAVDYLGKIRHARAAELLRKLAEGTFGGDNVRLAAMRQLVSLGVWSRQDPHTLWLQGKWTEVKSLEYELNASVPASATRVDDALMPRYAQAVKAANRGENQKAVKLWRELIAEDPAHAPFHLNLGVCLLNMQCTDEAEACIRRAMDLEPDYLFAPCTLALLCLDKGRVEEARRILDDVVVPEQVHPDALSMYMAAQIQVAMDEKEPEKAASWLKMAQASTPDHPSIRKLGKRLGIVGLVSSALQRFRSESRTKVATLRQRVLPRSASLGECYGAYSKSALAGMARALGLAVGTGGTRKAELLAAVCAALRSADTCARVIRSLGERDRAGLHDLLAAGGMQDYAAFTRRHGSDAEDFDEWAIKQPESTLGRLKCRGLLVEATVDRVESVFVPAELTGNLTSDFLARPLKPT